MEQKACRAQKGRCTKNIFHFSESPLLTVFVYFLSVIYSYESASAVILCEFLQELQHEFKWQQNTFAKSVKGGFFFFKYFIQHCFIYRSSDSSVSEDDGIDARTVANFALAVRGSITTRLQ
jgi:hypothetical protein